MKTFFIKFIGILSKYSNVNALEMSIGIHAEISKQFLEEQY